MRTLRFEKVRDGYNPSTLEGHRSRRLRLRPALATQKFEASLDYTFEVSLGYE